MAVKTQGTNLYALNPDDGVVLDVGCVTAISGIDETVEQIETTCLGNNSRTYESGLSTPGTANFTIQFDPENPVHVTMLALKKAGKKLDWAVGFRQKSAAEGTDPLAVPTSTTDSSGDYLFTLPPERSWLVFEGFMNSYPFDFQLNGIVSSNVGIQVSGEIDVVPKSAS